MSWIENRRDKFHFAITGRTPQLPVIFRIAAASHWRLFWLGAAKVAVVNALTFAAPSTLYTSLMIDDRFTTSE